MKTHTGYTKTIPIKNYKPLKITLEKLNQSIIEQKQIFVIAYIGDEPKKSMNQSQKVEFCILTSGCTDTQQLLNFMNELDKTKKVILSDVSKALIQTIKGDLNKQNE